MNEQRLSDASSALCWYSTLSGKHDKALAAGEKAVALLKDDKARLARLNFAHALLFNGQFDKASAIYSQYLGQSFEDGRKWNEELHGDFKLLRAQGHTHPDMAKIEALLK